KVKRLGIPDRLVEHGTQLELQHECGFDPQGIEEAALDMLRKKVKSEAI
ncbi:MAG: 1-deoxy-D-xylulose-5-phosphate synthase, partial [Spirosomataceae bacterium]